MLNYGELLILLSKNAELRCSSLSVKQMDRNSYICVHLGCRLDTKKASLGDPPPQVSGHSSKFLGPQIIPEARGSKLENQDPGRKLVIQILCQYKISTSEAPLIIGYVPTPLCHILCMSQLSFIVNMNWINFWTKKLFSCSRPWSNGKHACLLLKRPRFDPTLWDVN